MLLYNVTIGIDKEIEMEWLAWMKAEHIPDVMNCGMFIEYRFYRILTHDEEGTVSYCVQYYTDDIVKVRKYLDEFAPSLVEKHKIKYKDRHVAFRTLLEEV
jgi:hypothetical protein